MGLSCCKESTVMHKANLEFEVGSREASYNRRSPEINVSAAGRVHFSTKNVVT